MTNVFAVQRTPPRNHSLGKSRPVNWRIWHALSLHNLSRTPNRGSCDFSARAFDNHFDKAGSTHRVSLCDSEVIVSSLRLAIVRHQIGA